MHASKEVQAIEKNMLRTNLPEFRTGDTVIVHSRIKEGGKERIQFIEGVVIRKQGKGSTKTFTIRKISDGIGVELIYPTTSPTVANIEVKSHGAVRRSRLFYLRSLTGKAAKLKSKDGLAAQQAAKAAGTHSKASAGVERAAYVKEKKDKAAKPAKAAKK